MSFQHFNGRNIGLDHDGIDLTDYGSYGTHKSNYKPVAASENVEVSEGLSARPIVRRKPLSMSSTQRLIPEGIFDDATPTTLPRTLRRNTVANILTSLVLMALALPFFTFAGFAWNLHDKPVTDQEEWDRLNEMGNKLATAFPFVFSLVVGNTVRQIAGWKLERGTTLGSTEQMMGSLTVGSAVATQVFIRRFNLVAILLLCTWALSPIGSQSSLQILRVGNRPVNLPIDVDFFNTESMPGFSEGDLWNLPSLNAMFSSSLMAPAVIRNSSMDLWGNVKIPDVSRLSISFLNSTGWFNFPFEISDTNLTYSSVLGIPLSNVPKTGNTTFSMETSYLALNCYDNITIFGSEDGSEGFLNYTNLFNENIALKAGNGTLSNSTYYAPVEFFRTFSMALDGFYRGGTYGMVQEYENDTTTYEPRTLIFQSKWGNATAWCPMTTSYVESVVECVGVSCAVTAIRPSQLHHPNSNLTNFGFIEAFGEFTTTLMNASSAELHDATSTALELFITDPDLAPQAGLSAATMQGVSANDFGSRLQQVLNTYWFGSYDPVSMMGFLNTNSSLQVQGYPSALSTQGTNVIWQEIYMCRFGWLFALLLATSIMFGAAIVGGIFSFLTHGPEVLGYSSTHLRDSPYVSAPRAGSATNGIERARVFADMRLRLVDVDADKEVGYLAIAEDRGGLQGGLMKGRLYR